MRYLHWLSFFTLILGFVLLAWVNYSLFWPIKTLTVAGSDKPIPVLTTSVFPGQPLSYELDYCKYTNLAATVHRTFIDGQIITLQDTVGQLPMGCHKTMVKTAVVPETINPGRYYLDVNVEYRINILRTEYTHYRTEYFVVLDPATGEAPSSAASPLPEQIIIEK